jgi:hypothetical protein
LQEASFSNKAILFRVGLGKRGSCGNILVTRFLAGKALKFGNSKIPLMEDWQVRKRVMDRTTIALDTLLLSFHSDMDR